MTTLEIVKEVLSENLGIEPEEVSEDSTLDSLGIDSLDMVELICEIEERCEIEFGEPEGIDTISDLIDHIESL